MHAFGFTTHITALHRYNTETVSGEVLGHMKQRMVESSSSASHSFLLDDDSTLPFAAAEVLGAMDDSGLYAGIPLPDALKDAEHSGAGGAGGTPMAGGLAGGFAFLEKELRFSTLQPGSGTGGPAA